MPRIPQGNFDTAPSMNVSTAKIEPIKSVGTQILRGAGKQAIQLADTWSNVKAKADALDGVSKAEDEVNALTEEIKQLAKNSINGKFEGRDLSDITSEKVTALRTRHLASMDGKAESAGLYNQLVAPKLDSMINSAFEIQNKQIKEGFSDKVESMAYDMQMKMRNGTLTDEDMGNFTAVLNSGNGIFSAQEIAKTSATTRKTLAINASSMMGNGWSPEVEAKAKQWMDKLGVNLTEGEKIAAQMNFDRYREEGIAVARRKAEMVHNNVVKIDNIQEYIPVRGAAVKSFTTQMSMPPQPWETPEQHQTKIDELGAFIIANDVAIANKNIFSDPEKIAKDISVMKAQLLGDRAPSSSAMDELIQKKLTAMQAKIHTKGGAMASYMDANPEFALDMKDPSKLEGNMAKVNDFYNANKVESQNRTVMSVAEAQEYGKLFKKVNSGDADPTGEHMLKLTRDLQKKYGSYAGKALSDIIQLGGGTASGSTNAPASLALGNYFTNDNELADVYSAINRMDENKKVIAEDEYKKIDKYIRESTAISKIRHGKLSDNDNFANGYTDGIKALAMTYMVSDKMSASNAVEEAEKRMQKNMAMSFQEKASVVIPRESLNNKNYTEDDLTTTLNNMTNFNSLSEIAGNIDWNALASAEPKSLTGMQMKKVASETDPKARAELAQKYFGDGLMIVNDGTNPDNVSAYIRTATNIIPLYMKTQGGKTRRFNVNMLDMINNDKARKPVQIESRPIDEGLYGEQ